MSRRSLQISTGTSEACVVTELADGRSSLVKMSWRSPLSLRGRLLRGRGGWLRGIDRLIDPRGATLVEHPIRRGLLHHGVFESAFPLSHGDVEIEVTLLGRLV